MNRRFNACDKDTALLTDGRRALEPELRQAS